MAKVNWDATFQDFKKAKFDDILAYCEEKGGELYDSIEEIVKEGKPFLAIKKAFYKSEYPQYIPQPKPAELTMKEKMAASRAKRAAKK